MLLKAISQLAIPIALLCASANANFINGGFDTGDLTGWNSLGEVSVSAGESYDPFGSVAPDSGPYAARLRSEFISAADIAAQMGLTEETLEASNQGLNATNGSLIWQTVTVNVGDVLQFRWNFVEQDYLPYDDWAFYGIQFNGGTTELTKFASLGTVGPESGSTVNGWTELHVHIQETGDYTFYFGVVNAVDEGLSSDLWMDGAYSGDEPPAPIESEIPEPATFALILPALAALIYGKRRCDRRKC